MLLLFVLFIDLHDESHYFLLDHLTCVDKMYGYTGRGDHSDREAVASFMIESHSNIFAIDTHLSRVDGFRGSLCYFHFCLFFLDRCQLLKGMILLQMEQNLSFKSRPHF